MGIRTGATMYSGNVAKALRERLESTAFPDLGAMMEGYAQAAVERARSEFARKLDFSS